MFFTCARQIRFATFTGFDPSGSLPSFAMRSSSSIAEAAANVRWLVSHTVPSRWMSSLVSGLSQIDVMADGPSFLIIGDNTGENSVFFVAFVE